ncbi:MAG: trypsin-like peptidase domain-containing protein, partial [Candidatus Aerophobetes bacterium]|nr:trypsin-like peptidase domain-containing protein [Candidatus Aerophobetes bacterium]
ISVVLAGLTMNSSLLYASSSSQPILNSEEEISLSVFQKTVIKVSEKVTPAVVNISTVRIVADFFLNPVPQQGLGSGVIFDPEGYILTNEHVVHEAEEIKVILPDGREFEGEPIGSDPVTDLAVVKIKSGNLPVAKLGDSKKIKVGEFCIAIGNPFGLQSTVTFGVISAADRSIRVEPEKVLENLIQTDAAINPGNSGGALINLKGEVIGINTAIIPYAQGIGFAIPVNTAKEIVGKLIKYGRVIRPWLGIYYLSITPQLASRFKLPVEYGIYIVSVAFGGPAHKAGLTEGDIIIKFNNQELKASEDLKSVLSKARIGEKVSLTILRGGKLKAIQLTLEERPEK